MVIENDFFSSSNTVQKISEDETLKLANYLELVKAFARTTYSSIYIID
jgi:hypothetical protein